MVSDAFDSDFSNGFIKDIYLENINGDGVDFSGSKVRIKNINGQNIKDKLISAGESSKIEVFNLKSKNVGVSVASKDGSDVKITDCSIVDTKLIPFMTYIKKQNYSSPIMNITNCNIDLMNRADNLNSNELNDLKYFRQKGTNLNVDGISEIVEKDLDVDLLYQTTIMKK